MTNQVPSERSLVSLMLGSEVVIEYLAGPGMGLEDGYERLESGEVLRAQPEARTALAWLDGYSTYGVEVSFGDERKDEKFIAWGAVLRLYGYSREQLESAARQDAEEQGNHDDER